MKPKILVVEDQEMVMEQLGDFLEWIGCEVVGKAKNGTEAISIFPKCGAELVTMDLIMPDMDGSETTKKLMELDPKARILVFTSLDVDAVDGKENNLVQQALRNGAISAVCKFSKTGISDELESIFGDRLEI